MNKVKDYFVNLFLEIRLWLYFRLKFKIKRYYVKGYTMFPQNASAMFKFGASMPWGEVHPDHTHQITTGNSVLEKIEFGIRTLVFKHIPYNMPYVFDSGRRKGEKVYPSIDAGVVHSRDTFKYGAFQIKCILPESNSAWPAFWLMGKESWPPEIDWFEFMPGSISKKGKYRMSTNFHTESDNGKNQKPRSYKIEDDITGKKITIAGKWTPNSLSFYYDGILVRRVTAKRLLKKLNQQMFLIIGTGAMSNYDDDIYDSSFIVTQVKYGTINDIN